MEFPTLSIRPIDVAAKVAAAQRQRQLTKPAGALGRLETAAIELAGVLRTALPQLHSPAAVIFASDHPVAKLGVSAYPQEVTAAMVANFIGGGAAASVLARVAGATLHIVDVGVVSATTMGPQSTATLHRDDVANDVCGDLVESDAMTEATFARAFAAGVAAINRLPSNCNIVALGEMGIGNTTCAAAVTAALLELDAHEVTGLGTGIAADGLALKTGIVARASARGRGATPAEILQRCGGRELVAIAGAACRAAERGMAIVVDGFIVTAAIACAARAVPALRPYLFFAHRSVERGHAALLADLDATAMIDLDLRLGECSGALLILPILHAACVLHSQMATFADASVPDRAP
jgi:nicotinate-nucleotide--dimethylbenzimidazole phosphoribosyltransferase